MSQISYTPQADNLNRGQLLSSHPVQQPLRPQQDNFLQPALHRETENITRYSTES